MNDPSARMARLEAPVASPGHCAICGKSEHPQGFVDPRLDYEWYGTVIFCYDCAGSFGEAVGYMSPEQFADLKAQFEQQAETIRVLEQSVANLESAVESVTRVNNDYRKHSERKRASEYEPVAGPPAEREPDRVVEVSPKRADESQLNVAAPVNLSKQRGVEQGPNDLLDTSVADSLLGL